MRQGFALIAGAVLAVTVGALLAGAAAPSAEAPAKEGVSLTVYNQNFAVIKEVRQLAIGAKVATVEFKDVAKQIDATSVAFKSLTDPAGTTVLEQNYEFDLVSADKLLDKYLDKTLTVVTKQAKTYEGALQSFDPEQIILKGKQGIVMIQRPDNVQNIEFGALPEGLLTRPTLVWKVATEKPGPHLVQVTYQTQGASWQADYSAVVNPDDTKMDLSGWVTITNQSGAAYKEARVKLIAGEVRRIQPEPKPEEAELKEAAVQTGGLGGGKPIEEKPFFEYHMYTLQQPTTVNDNQIKQVELLRAADVPVLKRYVFEPDGPYWHPRYGQSNEYKVNVFVEFKNSKENHLGMALPKGKVRVYKRDPADNDLEFVGEDQIDHTPKDEELKLYVGDAFDIVGERIVTDQKQAERWRQESVKIEIRNHKDADIKVLVREHLAGGQWDLTAKSQDFKKVDAQTIEFELPVPKNGKAQVTYTVMYRW